MDFSFSPDWKLVNSLVEIEKLSIQLNGRSVPFREHRNYYSSEYLANRINPVYLGGILNAIHIVVERYKGLELSIPTIKGFHAAILKFHLKDPYKGQFRNEPDLENSIDDLIISFKSGNETGLPDIVKTAIFFREFIRLSPFNSAVMETAQVVSFFLLLKSGYTWLNITRWLPDGTVGIDIRRFVADLENEAKVIVEMVGTMNRAGYSKPRKNRIIWFVNNHPGCNSAQIAKSLVIPLPTVKRLLTSLTQSGILRRTGNGPATSYFVKE